MINKYLIKMFLPGCIAVASVLFLNPARAEERILAFHSDIQVKSDGSMEVTETIRVRAEGRKIKRGIYRDFPTTYKKTGGREHKVGFEIINIERDGQPEPWHSIQLENGTRVYIGDATKYIKGAGEISYRLKYRTDRQLGFFDAHDELYWNVTGNGWDFPIDQASAKVSLPQGVPLDELDLEGYTGPQGSQAQHFVVERDGQNSPLWHTRRALNAQEGLTIVLGWPKGFIERPDLWQRLKWLIRDNTPVIAGLVVLLLAFIAYYRAWLKVGRDPEPGVLVAQYAPPGGMTAAAVSYLVNMRFGHAGLSAAIIELAVKGVHEISEPGKKHFRLVRLRNSRAGLNEQETALLDALYGGQDTIDIKKGQHAVIRSAEEALGKVLKDTYFGTHFTRNGRHIFPGMLVCVIGLLLVALSAGAYATGALAAFFPALFITGIWVILFTFKRSALQDKFVLFVLGIFVFVICSMLVTMQGSWFLLLFLTATIMTVVFINLLRAYTRRGRQVMDEIEGFKLYLSTAEQNRMNTLTPPERTPELFEKYLPYALALGVENQWAEQFSDILSAASQAERQYQPGWYSGSHWNIAKPAAFAGALGAGLATTISAASVAPGSRSSGGGGGGFSGGGGGGGGGGGW